VAPPILAYADLLATRDGRSIEAATLIYERYIDPHFVAPVKPVDPLTRGVLRCVDRVATMVAARYLVVGAMARDLVLVNAFGLRSGGATRDIDFGLSVENWKPSRCSKTALVETAQFEALPRLRIGSTGKIRKPGDDSVDLIPFGGVASEDKTIAWPPNQDFVMSVAGFERRRSPRSVFKWKTA